MKPCIHIIEDDIDILTILQLFLKGRGFKVIADYNGENLDLTPTPTQEIYFIDINLAGKSGMDICKRIKKECKNISVVLMSANTHLAKIAAECDADAFIAKPFNMDAVLSAIDKVAA